MISQHGDLVLKLVEKWACVVPPGGIRPEHGLLRDLKMDGDDYALSLVPELKRQLGIGPTRKEWEVVTVGELLQLVERHVGRRGGPDEQASA